MPAVLIASAAVDLLISAQVVIRRAVLRIFTKTNVFQNVQQVLYLLVEYAPHANRLAKLVTVLLQSVFHVIHQLGEVY